MAVACFRDFLTKAQLGPLVIGILQSDVALLLGTPTDTSVSHKPRIWRFGSLQFAFDTQSSDAPCIFMGLYFRNCSFAVPDTLELSGWWPTVGESLPRLREYAERESITLSEYRPLTFEDQYTLISEGGVYVGFTLSNDNEWVIDSIQCSVKAAANKAISRSDRPRGS
jgi:hypothetical protein